MRSAIALIFITLLPLSACQTVLEPAYPARSLAPPLSQYHHVKRRLTLIWKQKSRQFDCELITRPGVTRITALTKDGKPVFELRQSHSSIDIERSPNLPPRVSSAVLLADIQLIYWPKADLRENLHPPMRLVDKPDYRALYQGDNLEAYIHYGGTDHWISSATLFDNRYGYQLLMRPLSQNDTQPPR